MRYRGHNPADLDRARSAVAAWRDRNPAGTDEELIAAIGGQFDRDYEVVLRAVLFAVDRHRARSNRNHHREWEACPVNGSHAWLIRPALRPVPDELDQVLRLARFREAHPSVMVAAGRGWWQAVIPEADGETVITRYTLRELLDKLDDLLASWGR